MKPIVQKLSSDGLSSFVAKTFTTPHYEVGWHHHSELELIVILQGSGISLVGDYIGNFEAGDVFFLGSGLPHTFKKGAEEMIASAMVVQFNEDFLGTTFLQLPETAALKEWFSLGRAGFKLHSEVAARLARRICDLEHQRGLSKLTCLLSVLSELQESRQLEQLSIEFPRPLGLKSKNRMDDIVGFTIEHFKEAITLEMLASRCRMTVPAFCLYFKQTAHKTYMRFLNEVRIGHACRMLVESGLNVSEICFESGFNTLANFNRQFQKIKSMTPSAYRRKFCQNLGY